MAHRCLFLAVYGYFALSILILARRLVFWAVDSCFGLSIDRRLSDSYFPPSTDRWHHRCLFLAVYGYFAPSILILGQKIDILAVDSCLGMRVGDAGREASARQGWHLEALRAEWMVETSTTSPAVTSYPIDADVT